ncbi:MAG: hypothetical protein ABI210_11335, partial [Abditibacteriaceae bacterium]
VSPDQFLPRGAEVIINSNNTITINLDPLTDNSTTYPSANFASNTPTPDPAKCWRNADGSLAGDTTNGGVYSRTFNWPADGTLFAEGNIRIRGTDASAPSSLTVVSMNNIYIEGSLSTGAKKVLLLAKKNVIVNPTQVLEDVQSATLLSAPAVALTPLITVYDASNFRVGDYIQIAGDVTSGVQNVHGIQAIVGNTITLDSALALPPSPILANAVVNTVFDPQLAGLPSTAAIRLSQFTQAIQRRVQLNAGANTLRLAFRHNAEYKKALDVQAMQETGGPPTPPPTLVSATMVNKLGPTPVSPAPIDSVIQAKDKALTVNYTENPPNTPAVDTFPQTQPTSQATASGITLAQLQADMTTIAAARTAPKWHYQVTVDNGYDTATNQPLYYFMAGMGNLFNNFYATVATPWASQQQDIFQKTVTIPMATSVWVTMNGQQVQLQDNHWNTMLKNPDGSSAPEAYGKVNQFGFNPIFINSDGTNPLSADPSYDSEDALTTDQYFYQPNGTEAPASAAYSDQTTYDNGPTTQYTLDSRQLQGFTIANTGGNDIAIQLDNAGVDGTGQTVTNYFDPGKIPFYRLSNLKVENETLDSSHEVDSIAPADTFNINAYVYAQEGGWYVISGTNFDANVKNSDDLNRDGVISQGESAAAYRYHRYNYQIVFTGAIMENQTAIVNTDGGTPGQVSDWMDKWATVNLTSANFTAGTPPTLTLNATPYNSGDPANSNFDTILYFYDQTAATGALATDTGFHEPVAPGLIYQG